MNRRTDEDYDIENLLIHPPYWLVYALPWPSSNPESSMAEAAFAIAPRAIGRDIPQYVDGVLGVAAVYAKEHPTQRVVWFTDLTRWLGARGHSWTSLDIDWERALMEICGLPILGLYMTVSRRAYVHLGNAAERCTIFYNDGKSEQLTEEEREAVHAALEEKLDSDWPPYVRTMLSSRRLTIG
ncbi:MAG: hypothetical protein LC799_15790 [Actinobacteria bacterium]|nr:hypothetical protein [Actinomycetota bacterium]